MAQGRETNCSSPSLVNQNHSLVPKKQRWLQALHNIKATYQDHYRDKLRKRSAGSVGKPTHEKETPNWSSTLIWGDFTGSSQKSQHKEWLSPENGELVLGAHQGTSYQATLTPKQVTAICKWKCASTTKMCFTTKHFASWLLLLLFMPLITLTALCRTGCNWNLRDCT